VPKGDVPYAVVRIGPVPPGAEVRLADDAGRPVAADVSDRRHREFLLPWTDGDAFTGNPCIARFDTLSAGELAAVRIGLSGQVLHRVATFPGPMRSYVALADLVAVLDDGGVTLLDWRHEDRPRRVGAVPLTDAVALAAAGSHLVVLSASEVVMLELGVGNEPTVRARGEIDGGEPFACSNDCLAVARADTAVLYTLDDGRIRVAHALHLPLAPTHLAFSARRIVIAGGSEVVLLSRDGDVLATWTAADPIEDVVASGRSIWVRSRTMDTRLEATGDELLPVSSVTRARGVPTFGPAPQPGRLLHHTNDNQLELWAVSRHQLRRDRFKEAFTVRTHSLKADHQ
jgi:hypothetical protein